MSDITIAQFTDGAVTTNTEGNKEWTGTGVFDVIMKAVNGNILVEYENGRIAGPDYATVYLGSMQTAIGAAIDFVLREKVVEEQIAASQADTIVKQNQVAEQIAASKADTAIKQSQSTADLTLKAQQATKLGKETLAVEEQTLLYERQRHGFDDNKNQKLLETQMSSWGLMFSSGLLTEKPAIITSDEVSKLYNYLKPV